MAILAGTSSRNALKIVPAFFLQSAFVLGTVKSMGIFLPELEADLGITPTDIGLSLGLFQAFHFGLTPIPTYIYCNSGDTYRRLLLICGAALAAGGLLMGCTITNKAQLAVYLTVSGVGTNMVSSVLVITLSAQSGDDFKLFYGLGKSGFALGMALVPLLAHYLMTIYGWRGSLMIVGGIMTHLIPFTMAVDTRKESCKEKSYEDDESEGIKSKSPENCERHSKQVSGSDDANGKESSVGPTNDGKGLEKFAESQNNLNERNVGRKNLLKNQEMKSVSKVDRNKTHDRQNETRSRAILEKVSYVVTGSIFYQDLWLTFLMIVTGLFGIIDGGWHAFLIPRAVKRGIPTSQAVALAYSAGGGCFIGRCFSGVLPMTKHYGGHEWFLLLTVINCVMLLVDILILDFRVMFVSSFVSALCIAELDILQVTLCKERCPYKHFPIVFAVEEIIFGTAELLGDSISGCLADIYDDFNASFIFLLVVEACILMMMVILKFTKHPI